MACPSPEQKLLIQASRKGFLYLHPSNADLFAPALQNTKNTFSRIKEDKGTRDQMGCHHCGLLPRWQAREPQTLTAPHNPNGIMMTPHHGIGSSSYLQQRCQPI